MGYEISCWREKKIKRNLNPVEGMGKSFSRSDTKWWGEEVEEESHLSPQIIRFTEICMIREKKAMKIQG